MIIHDVTAILAMMIMMIRSQGPGAVHKGYISSIFNSKVYHMLMMMKAFLSRRQERSSAGRGLALAPKRADQPGKARPHPGLAGVGGGRPRLLSPQRSAGRPFHGPYTSPTDYPLFVPPSHTHSKKVFPLKTRMGEN